MANSIVLKGHRRNGNIKRPDRSVKILEVFRIAF
jgi:hypothetical protein